jgi:GNAT superfamily N-acetyltransferase
MNERLTKAGLGKHLEMAGLILRDISAPFSHDPQIRVEEFDFTTPEILPTLTRVAATGFDMPESVAGLFSEAYLTKADFRIRGYLAYLPDADEPGAFGASIYLPNKPVLLLCGAATIPEQRGKGLYQALVARRLADAAQDGLQYAIIQAVRTTSAPILQKRGFEELSALEMWVGVPQAN